ncbi:MAG: hypothetical protein H3C47_13150 [Candidatus Cloacimonetes bacterium]|nr:hypothetical protein [Candidatus Cloacimonadota bacterium]
MATASDSQNQAWIAYLAFQFPSADRFTVGLLSLDKQGFPVDFRFSSPVQPTAMQKALYGATLESWLIQSIAKDLFKDMAHKPQLVITNYKEITSEWLGLPLYLLERGNTVSDLVLVDPLGKKEEELLSVVSQFTIDLQEPFKRIEQALALIPPSR